MTDGKPGPAFRWPADRRPTTPQASDVQPRGGWSVTRILATCALALGVFLSFVVYFMPTPSGMSAAAQASAAVFVLATTLWITQFVPFGITGLLALALLGLVGGMKPNQAFAAFGNSAVFFLLGVFVLGGALVASGVSKRCALLFLRPFERSPYAFATGIMLAAAFGTMWMPNQATTAMLYPIVLEVAVALRLRAGVSGYAKVLFLSLAWGAMVGSNASILGSTRAALALGMLHQTHGTSITFAQWVVAALPMVIVGIAVGPAILRWCFPHEDVSFVAARALLERSVREMGPASRRQWRVGAIVALTVAAWVLLGDRVDLAVIALLGAVALFATRSLTWEEAEGRIYWNIVLMYGGAITLGVALDSTGAARWVAERYLGDLSLSPLLTVAGVVVATLLLSEFMSNAAAVAVMLPLAFSLGERLGVSPIALTLATSIGAGLDFALPFSSAPNTIVFASGYLRMTDVIKAGGMMTIASVAIVVLIAWFWWPLIGLV